MHFCNESWNRTNRILLKRKTLHLRAISTYRDELPLLLHTLLEYEIQLTTYLLPRELLSDVLRPMSCIKTVHRPLTLRTSPWVRPLEPIHYPFSYQLTDWFCSEDSTTCFSLYALVPLRASRRTFFPLHQLCCYIHRSYQ